MKRLVTLPVALATVGALLALTGQASAASIWTEIPSATTQNITAIEYQSATRFWYTTSAGAIFTRQANGSFAQTRAPGGIPLNDIEFQSGGQIGLAVGNGGLVLRSIDGGATWAPVTSIPVSNTTTTFPDCKTTKPLGDVNAVRFAGNGRAWIFASGSQLATSQPPNPAQVGATGTWIDANRDTHGSPDPANWTCKIYDPVYYADGLADGFFVPDNPDVGYIIGASFSTVFFTANNLASSAQTKPEEAGNAGSVKRVVAGDPVNPDRMWSVNSEPYGISTTGYTRDGWQTGDRWQIGNDKVRDFPGNGPADVDYAGGTVLAAGDSGLILNSVDGVTFYYSAGDGPLATQRWNAVGLASAGEGAVGGDGGKLAVTSQANFVPDLVPPTGTISGPASVTAGVPVTYTAVVSDGGGSGLDASSLAWTAPGLAGASGQSATFTFPSAGFYSLKLTFRDGAGNTGQATLGVFASSPSSGGGTTTTPVDTRPLATVSLSGKGNGASARIRGSKVKFTIKGAIAVPAGVNKSAACNGSVLLTIKNGKALISARTAKITKSCTFSKTVNLARKKVGRAKKLAVTMRFQGNTFLRPSTKNLSVKIRR
jgi:hypothetical protein